MPVKAGQSYAASVNNAYLGESQSKGTPAIFFTFAVEEDGKPAGVIDHALWITDGTKDRVVKTMHDCFGVTLEQLQSQVFLDNIANELAGRKVNITTIEETYQNKPRVKVQWMNPETKKPEGDLMKRAASMFGGAKPVDKRSNGGLATEPPPFPPDDERDF